MAVLAPLPYGICPVSVGVSHAPRSRAAEMVGGIRVRKKDRQLWRAQCWTTAV